MGEETTNDEAGCAAYKSVELDESLGGGPVQYREVQGAESPLFQSYFRAGGYANIVILTYIILDIPVANAICFYCLSVLIEWLLSGLRYAPGGVASGFRKVERDVYPTRLLHCKVIMIAFTFYDVLIVWSNMLIFAFVVNSSSA